MARPWKHTKDSLGKPEHFEIVDGPHYINGETKPVWKCLCFCGKEFYEQGARIHTGRRQSCGCISKLNRWQKKYESPEESAYQRIILRYKSNSKKLKREWSITDEIALKLFKGKCHYCGREPYKNYQAYISKTGKYRIGDKEWCENAVIKFNGIDRIDSKLGYIIDNIVSCCYICNRAKNDLTVEEFKEWAKDLCQHDFVLPATFTEISP